MANIMQLQNGRTKVFRGRFGGETTRMRDDWDNNRRRTLDRIIDADSRAQVSGALTERKPTVNGGPTARFCPIAQQDVPLNGTVRIPTDSGCVVTLVYEDGRIIASSARG